MIIQTILKKGSAAFLTVAMLAFGLAPVASADHADTHMTGAAAVVLEQNGGAEIQAFTPDLGLDSSDSATVEVDGSTETSAYYGVSALISTSTSDVHWQITIDHETEALVDGDVTIEEVGTFDVDSGQVRVSPATYSTAEVGGDLVLSGDIDGWSIEVGENFTNIDEITFAADAPLGTYTITRVLIDESTGAELEESFEFTVTLEEEEVIVPPTGADVTITGSANGTIILNGDESDPETLATYSPDIDLSGSLDVILEGSTSAETVVYYATDASISTSTSSELSEANIQWKIVVEHESEALDVSDVEIREMGYYFQINGGTYFGNTRDGEPFPYNPTTESGALVFTGDGSLEGSEGMMLTNVDEITFAADAPQGTYTITRILTVPSLSMELEDSFSFDITLGEEDGGGDGDGETPEEPVASLTITSPSFPLNTSTNPLVITGTATTSASLLTVTGGAATATTTVDAEGDWSLSVNLTADATNTLLLTLTDDEENVVATSSVVVTHATEVTDGDDEDEDNGDNSRRRRGGFARAAVVTPLASTVPGNAFGLTMIQGEVLGATTISPEMQIQINAIKAQIVVKIQQLINLLQARILEIQAQQN